MSSTITSITMTMATTVHTSWLVYAGFFCAAMTWSNLCMAGGILTQHLWRVQYAYVCPLLGMWVAQPGWLREFAQTELGAAVDCCGTLPPRLSL
jgi:hypothetical protein